MTSMPDVPPPGGPSAGRRPVRVAATRARYADPVRYVGALLLWQGTAWLLLSAAGLACWIALVPASASRGTSSSAVLWAGAALLAIAIGGSAGAGQACLACRLRDHARWAGAAATVFRGFAIAAALVAAAIAVMIAGSLLEVLALSGAS